MAAQCCRLVCRSSSCKRVACDVLAIAALVVVLVGVLAAKDAGRVVRRGFFCDDKSIRLPFQEETVPDWALILASLAIPILAMLLGNMYERYVHKRVESARPLTAKRYKIVIPHWITRFGFQFRWFVIGILITVVVTEISKIVVGRLRPHFIDVCDPDFSMINCTDEYSHPVYVTAYECRGKDSDVISARVSWPSGHSSVSAYAFIFTALYLASVRSFYQFSGLKIFLMLVSFLLALLTGLSRISDHRHHPTDVLSGLALGVFVAVGIVYFNLHYFSHFKKCSNESTTTIPGVPAEEPSDLSHSSDTKT